MRFNAIPVKYEEGFRDAVLRLVGQHIDDENDQHMLFLGAEKNGDPAFYMLEFDIDAIMDDDDEVDRHTWNVWLSESFMEADLIPSFLTLACPVSMARYDGDIEMANFYALHTMTWCQHNRSLVPAEEIDDDQAQYALERYCAPENNGPLEEMADIAREYVLRKG